MCDEAVTVTPHATILGVIDTLTVSSISSACSGDMLKVALRTILGVTLQTSATVPEGASSVVLNVLSLNLLLVNLGTTYVAFEPD